MTRTWMLLIGVMLLWAPICAEAQADLRDDPVWPWSWWLRRSSGGGHRYSEATAPRHRQPAASARCQGVILSLGHGSVARLGRQPPFGTRFRLPTSVRSACRFPEIFF